MSKNAILVLLILIPLGCRTSMGTRKDASPGAEAGTPDVSRDSLVTTDGARPDLPSADAMSALGVPKAFRIENHSPRTIYLQTDVPVGCQVADASGWQRCTYFHGCSLLCSQVLEKQACCVECERNLELYEIPAGQGRSIPWDGRIFMRQTGLCSQCQCDQPIPVTSGDFEASVWIHTAYQCMPSGCQTSSDGIIGMAEAVGAYSSTKVSFSVPSDAEQLLIEVTQLPPQDAGPSDAHAGPDGRSLLDTPADSLAEVF